MTKKHRRQKKKQAPQMKKNALFVVDPNDIQQNSSKCINYMQIIVSSFSEFKNSLEDESKMHKQEYDSIVLFPAHGDELKPKIQ
jgi:hypothetical protein